MKRVMIIGTTLGAAVLLSSCATIGSDREAFGTKPFNTSNVITIQAGQECEGLVTTTRNDPVGTPRTVVCAAAPTWIEQDIDRFVSPIRGFIGVPKEPVNVTLEYVGNTGGLHPITFYYIGADGKPGSKSVQPGEKFTVTIAPHEGERTVPPLAFTGSPGDKVLLKVVDVQPA